AEFAAGQAIPADRSVRQPDRPRSPQSRHAAVAPDSPGGSVSDSRLRSALPALPAQAKRLGHWPIPRRPPIVPELELSGPLADAVAPLQSRFFLFHAAASSQRPAGHRPGSGSG